VSKSLKILVVRFSSIGDIVLTTPVIRVLKKQLNAEVHYLTKNAYSSLLKNNPNIDQLFSIKNSILEARKDLKDQKYDFIIDLHNNLRSSLLIFLGSPVKRYVKSNFKKFLFRNFGINFLKNKHVVDRYLDTISFLNIKNDEKGLEYYIDDQASVDFDLNQKYIAWAIGGSQIQKQISANQITKISERLNFPIVLIGGEEEKPTGDLIKENCKELVIKNFCGVLDLDQSALIIEHSFCLFSNDTGMMHIGAALNKKIVSFWGCTKPDMGFYPYINVENSLLIVSPNSKRQCSKHGDSCRYSKDGCIKHIEIDENLLKKILRFIS
jgi:heptosyltransferase-2